ncbi:hybrid sensor histidine kinase/response regulator [Oceanidesulfovibrio indonesiensis]|nr:PAS domain-containing sensor histidine kinase [Oceanidesulfovibrio indonesiensis]
MAPFNPEPYEERIKRLEEERRRALNALELAGSMGSFASSLNQLDSPVPILQETARKVQTLIRFKAMTLYMVNEADSDFNLAICTPGDMRSRMEEEVDALIANQTFSWALGRSKPVMLPAHTMDATLLVHSLATISRVRGIFVGVLDQPKETILDPYLALLTIIFSGAAQALESFELYGRISEMNRHLEQQVEERKRELSETSSMLAEERSRTEAADRALEEKNATIRAFFEASQDGMTIVDGEGVVVDVNRQAAAILGEKPENVQGRALKELLPQDYYGPRLQRFREIRRRGESIVLEDVYMDRRYELSIFPLRNAHGDVDRMACLSRDVTEDRQMHDALTAARDEARAASRAKTEFLANMSHELRTPLNGIMGMTQLLLATSLSETQRESCRDIMYSAGQVLRIVNDLLDLSSLENGRLALNQASFSTRRIFASICEAFATQARCKGLEFACTRDSDMPPFLIGDADRLRQIFINIVHNAVTFTGSGRVDVWMGIAPDLLSEPCKEGYAPFAFSVRDTGPGISAQSQETIFESFTLAEDFITKRSGGSGLGLAICKQLVERMGGIIMVQSELGMGSAFKVCVPLPTSQGIVSAEQDERKQAGSGLAEARVLLVEAAATQHGPDSTSQVLRQWGMEVGQAHDTTEALQMLQSVKFDLAVLDMQYTSRSGLEIVHAIRGRRIQGVNPKMPVIALNEFSGDGDRERCLAAGVNAVLNKPFDAEALVRAIQGMLSDQGSKTST